MSVVLLLCLYAGLLAWPAACAPATGDAAATDRYDMERQLMELLRKLQDKHQSVATASSAARTANIDSRARDSADGDVADEARNYGEPLEARDESYPANVLRTPEGRSAYTNRCRGDSRLCLNSYRIGSKRTEPSPGDLGPALSALSEDDEAAMLRSERRVRLELIRKKLLELYEEVRDLERGYAL